MDRTRAQEIIAAYGADVTRWPAAEREAAYALVMADAGLRTQLDAAAALDADITLWAMAPVPSDDLAATTAADAALASLPAPRRWLPVAVLGGSIAASLFAAVMILPSTGSDPLSEPTQIAAATPVQTAQVEQDVQLVGNVFTLTPEEESLI